MGNTPVLKPQEVVRLLSILGFGKFVSADRTSSSGTMTGAQPRFVSRRPRHFAILLRKIAADIHLNLDELLAANRK